jgi:hypothetical protein
MSRPPSSHQVKGSLSSPKSPKRFTDDDVREIREKRAEGATARHLAREYGVGLTAMHNLLAGATYGWVR